MDNEQKNERQDEDMDAAEDLEVSGDEAEGVAGGARKSDPDAGAQRR